MSPCYILGRRVLCIFPFIVNVCVQYHVGGVFNINLLSYTEITCFLKEHSSPDVPPSLLWACNFSVVHDTALPPKRGVTNSQNNLKLEWSSFVSDCRPGTFTSGRRALLPVAQR